MSERIIAACDGACKGNPGPAAWAWVIAAEADGGPGRWEAGPLGVATNNIAELTGLKMLLETVPPDTPLEVRMDSQYAMKAVTEWLPGWRKRGWKTSSGDPVKNRDLVAGIDALLTGRDVKFIYVPAHQAQGDPLNAIADSAASEAAVSQKPARGKLSPEQSATLAQTEAVTNKAAARAARKPSAAAGADAQPGSAEARPRRGTLAAKFPGTCGSCGRRYAAGELIAKSPSGWGHADCAG